MCKEEASRSSCFGTTQKMEQSEGPDEICHVCFDRRWMAPSSPLQLVRVAFFGSSWVSATQQRCPSSWLATSWLFTGSARQRTVTGQGRDGPNGSIIEQHL